MYLKGKEALIIDDLPGMRGSMRATLSSLGIESCDQTGTAREAVEKMRAKFYDLVVCDYYLGDATDGQQILEMVSCRRAHARPRRQLRRFSSRRLPGQAVHRRYTRQAGLEPAGKKGIFPGCLCRARR